MGKEVGEKKRVSRLLVLLGSIMLLSLCPTGALVITPEHVLIDDYASPQELVITFYNDGFEPVMCELTPAYTSSYLLAYASLEPTSFILQPGTQKNVKVTTSFPQDFPPQVHRLIIHVHPGSDQHMTISFRPPGDAYQQLQLQDVQTEFGDDQQTMVTTLDLKNSGNVILFVTPIILITKNQTIIKNITYPQPVIVQPGAIFPLALRQDNTDLPPGKYVAVLKASYYADDTVKETDEDVITFTITRAAAHEERTTWWVIIAATASVGIAIGGAARLIPPRKARKKRRQREANLYEREKHITPAPHDLHSLRREITRTHHEVNSLSKEIRLLVEEAEHYLRGGLHG
ncbi:hypothetical protein GF367_03060 [Candidatus Woesearchaeota archaeon]|nr:hypothetical protein [Candidatus Woesearchaeota archaeon]